MLLGQGKTSDGHILLNPLPVSVGSEASLMRFLRAAAHGQTGFNNVAMIALAWVVKTPAVYNVARLLGTALHARPSLIFSGRLQAQFRLDLLAKYSTHIVGATIFSPPVCRWSWLPLSCIPMQGCGRAQWGWGCSSGTDRKHARKEKKRKAA
eukprot:402120-Pelagomonas_calceolata.AAC.1